MALAFGNGSRTVNFSGNQQRGQASFRPGMAQPIQPQSTGTPYGRPVNMGGAYGGQPSSDMASWSTRGAASAAIGGRPVAQYGPGSYGGARGENPFSGIQPFTQTLNTPYGQMDPGQYYQQRDAFIQSANNQMGQYMPGGQSHGQQPQFNPQQMWGQAGQMVQQGWQNPMAQPGTDSLFAAGTSPAYAAAHPDDGPFMGGGTPNGRYMNSTPEYMAAHPDTTPWRNPDGSWRPSLDDALPFPPNAGGGMGWNDVAPVGRPGGASPYPNVPIPYMEPNGGYRPGMGPGWEQDAPPRATPYYLPGESGNRQLGTMEQMPRLPDRPRAPEAPPVQTRSEWTAAHEGRINSPENRRWLRSQTPANRRAYRALQGLY